MLPGVSVTGVLERFKMFASIPSMNPVIADGNSEVNAEDLGVSVFILNIGKPLYVSTVRLFVPVTS